MEKTLIHPSLLSWKSMFAGFLVSILTSTILFALGMGIGGSTLQSTFQENPNNISVGSLVWILITVAASLYAGSYFASRMAGFVTGRMGAAQGLVIASLFFVLMVFELGLTVGVIGLTGFSETDAQTAAQSAVANVSTAGWILFALTALGTLASLLGGATGARANIREPLAEPSSFPLVELKPAT